MVYILGHSVSSKAFMMLHSNVHSHILYIIFPPQKVGNCVFIKSITLVSVLALNSGACDLLWKPII